jgi:hypothetical protein
LSFFLWLAINDFGVLQKSDLLFFGEGWLISAACVACRRQTN